MVTSPETKLSGPSRKSPAQFIAEALVKDYWIVFELRYTHLSAQLKTRQNMLNNLELLYK